MAHLGKLDITVMVGTGDVRAAVDCEVRKAGATCNGAQSAVTTVNVYEPGGIVAADTVQVNGTGTAYTVSSVTATTVVLASAVTVAALDRLSPNTNKPTLYGDKQGTVTKSNPLSTDANGNAFAYVRGGQYDVYESGGTTPITATLVRDVGVVADDELAVHFTSPEHILDTSIARTTEKVLSVRTAGVEKFYVTGQGNLKGATFDGAVTVATGGLSATGGLTAVTSGLTVSAGGADITGDCTLRNNLLIGPLGSADTNLYRSAANVLKTDDSLVVAANLTVTGYTFLTLPADITVASATITLPAAGTMFILNAAAIQTVTAISGATAGQLLIFSAKSGTAAITFSGANFYLHGHAGVLDDISGKGGMIFYYDGTVFRLISTVT